MKQKIDSYLKDQEDHWVAKLECGHVQHVRHDPPFFPREWVLTEEGRTSHLGQELNCKVCDEVVKKVSQHLAQAYEEAGISGLCEEGRWEAVLGSFNQIKF